jgi:hypothetical protein
MSEDYDDYEDHDYDDADHEERGGVRRTDPDTSHDAAESLSVSFLEGLVVKALGEARTGLITHEIAHRWSVFRDTISPRMKPLRMKGKVYDSGERRAWHGSPGNPPSKRKSIVWQLTELRPPEEAEKSSQPEKPNEDGALCEMNLPMPT